MRGDKLTLVVACRDRLCRFGFELFDFMAQQNGGQLLVLSEPPHCPESELTSDSEAGRDSVPFLPILHVYRFAEASYSCRMHGRLRYRKEISEDPNIPKL